MDLLTKPFTVEDFDKLLELPENTDKNFEFIAGELVEVPSNPFSSKIGMRFGRYITAFVDDNNLGHVTGEAGLYNISGERYAPDVAYISIQRQVELAKTGANPLPPDLAVEVVSPSDVDKNVTIKVGNYLAAGTVVWLVRPDEQQVEIYEPGQPVKVLGQADTLHGGTVLPGFTLPLSQIFKL